tara:strand:+ start:141 stop:314 length:174 start_codon:yes stop_codon:yes gene_type:complete
MNNKKNSLVHAISSAGVAINTCLFGIHLFRDDMTWAIFALVCACLCWVGVVKNDNED